MRVAVVMASLDNAFYVAQKEGVEAEAARQPGAEGDGQRRPRAHRPPTR